MSRVELEIAIAALPWQVWSCLTDAHAVRAWLGAHMTLDARPGGGFREVWRDGGREIVTAGRVIEIAPPRRLVLSWADADWPAETHVTLTLEPKDTGTQLRLVHAGWEALGQGAEAIAAAHRAGWQQHLSALAAYVTRQEDGGAASATAGAMRLRPARAEEADALHALSIRSKAHWGYDAAFMALAAPKLALRAEWFAEGRVLAAELDGATAGVAAVLAPDAEGVAELGHLFVDPAAMGQGVGAALVAACVA
ncbi:MAG: GNAT family N-acetyltransferase [Tabrizicola sp.]